jgi:uncharacterized protein (TIGR02117 family)
MRHKGHDGLGLRQERLSKRLGVTLFKINSFATLIRALGGWIALILGAYMMAAVVGSLLPTRTDWAEAGAGTDIIVHDNGIHTSIILPNSDQTAPPRFDGDVFLADRARYPWVAIGWGDREFYLNTPTWAELSPRVGVTALIGSGQSLIHEDRLEHLNLEGEMRRVRLSDAELQRLLAHINAMRTQTVIAGYGADDRFFEAKGSEGYSILYTCNNWVADALHAAGVQTGRWTPLPFGVMWWYRDGPPGH